MTLTVHLFAKPRDLAGADAVPLDLPDGATVADLRRAIVELHPTLATVLARCAIAVNHDFAPDTATIPPGAEVAIIPPVSGG